MKYPRVTEALAGRIWALEPGKLDEVSAFVAALMDGTNAWPETRSDDGFDNRAEYGIIDGVAVISMEGVIERRANMIGNMSGGVSSQLMAQTIRDAASRHDVDGILLDIDSPGGSAMAPEEIARAVDEAKAAKPVIAWTGGLMCSAAYWIAAHADMVLASDTAVVGSIGVAAVHYDRSAADAKEGVRRTVLSAGHYKRLTSDEKPLSDEGRAYLQSQIDRYYSLFVEAVAIGRGMAVEAVSSMADGRTYIGSQAEDIGLVDGIATFETALDFARGNGVAMSVKNDTRFVTLADVSLEELTQGNPELVDEIGKAAVAKAAADIEAKAADAASQTATLAERSRITEILEADGDREATLQAIAAGIPAAEAYKQFYLAAKERRTEAREAMSDALGEATAPSGKPKATSGPDFMQAVEAHMKESGASKAQATVAMAKKHPELHAQFLNNLRG